METWKYWVAQLDLSSKEDHINKMQIFLDDRGNEGWELVSVTVQKFGEGHGEHSFMQYTMFFKRPA
jgi:hypothetical protein